MNEDPTATGVNPGFPSNAPSGASPANLHAPPKPPQGSPQPGMPFAPGHQQQTPHAYGQEGWFVNRSYGSQPSAPLPGPNSASGAPSGPPQTGMQPQPGQQQPPP
ncbi:hypothetical protein SARC_12272 [Sphaeroforma arctica JP610]|uniref:Uncharacterized protein n=1 Tax=Sphaeroforma arctica JP610 TaxID=667725 RepID=A0A0L0FGN3_9EUKA|nr:hypothetical protein SARC_12272 [Sphaeroforma arctica JP610]KNC75198.1 hypothetical protein SARC_12272 [Sphaeroforma arctica JP610]|eukprot:XP_014149100.1 hypothetical protein SARC_12272 [Sphaeroforma arctica JP610]